MIAFRPHLIRFSAFLLVLGSLAAVPARPAQAGQEVRFRRVFTLSEANLQDFDFNGAFWFFSRGSFVLDVSASLSPNGDCFVAAAGFGSGSGLNYKTGLGASFSVGFIDFPPCRFDAIDGVVRAKIPFTLDLFGEGGGSIPSEMRIAISASDVSISGVTIDINHDP
jgi:hypothetical protein